MTGGRNNLPVGVFDSGLGGISVLAQLMEIMPGEDYIYLGDCLNAPYGTRDVEDIQRLTFEAVNFLLKKGIKVLVVACNTATSAAIVQLREKLDIPVVGMEPALKPAVEKGRDGSIVVMATPTTLREEKFRRLMEKYRTKADIIPLPCPGLVELIEDGKLEGEEITGLLKKLVSCLEIKKVSTVVLGCTHYPLIQDTIQKVYGDAEVIDGNEGTARQVRRIMEEENLLAASGREKGEVRFYTFGDKEKVIPLCRFLLNHMLKKNRPLRTTGNLKHIQDTEKNESLNR